jgi:hypothetical protein
MRRGAFGVQQFKLDGTTGKYHRIGRDKNKEPMNGQRWGTDPYNAMAGWQKVQKGQAPTYILGRIADGYQVPPREECGDNDPSYWPDPNKDVWQEVAFLPCWQQVTREVILLSGASEGTRNAIGNFLEAFAEGVEAHPEDANTNKVPVVELTVESYESKHGKTIYNPVLELVDWVEMPAALLRVRVPPVKQLDLTALPSPESVAPSSAPARVKAVKFAGGGMDDEIPFAPCWW